MAATVSNVGTNTSTSSSATLTLGSVTASVGDMLVVFVAADNNGTNGAATLTTTMTDSGGVNVYTNRGGLINNDPGAARAGCTMSMWTCKVTSALAGATITSNYSPNTTSKVIGAYRVQPGAGQTLNFVSVGAGATGSSTTQSSGTVSVDGGQGVEWIIFGANAIETNTTITGDSDTTNGNWSTQLTATANTGTDLTSMAASAQWKIPTATGNQDRASTTAASKDWAANYLILNCVNNAALRSYGMIGGA